jgi:hypothetical protein
LVGVLQGRRATAIVSGGGQLNTANDTANSQTTTVVPQPDLTISMSHAGSFTQGQTGATYTIIVTNIGTGPTNAPLVGVQPTPVGDPLDLTVTALSGDGWSCTGSFCLRFAGLAAGASYPPITLTVRVAGNAPPSVTPRAWVTSNGDVNTTSGSRAESAAS